MRRFLVVIAGSLGLGTLWRRRRRPSLAALGPDPADELRARLAESRAVAPEAQEAPALSPEAPVADAEPSPLDPNARRRSLHERTRASMDELG